MKTKQIISALALVAFAFVANAQHYRSNGMPDMRYRENRSSYNAPAPVSNSTERYQNGFQRTNGTVVQGYYKTTSDNTNTNNWSTSGNTNPHTGQAGSRARDYSPDASNYGSGQTIQTGSRGGQSYLNNEGNRVYVPKR